MEDLIAKPKLTEVFVTKLTKDDREALSVLSDKLGVSISEIGRYAIRRILREHAQAEV